MGKCCAPRNEDSLNALGSPHLKKQLPDELFIVGFEESCADDSAVDLPDSDAAREYMHA